ncbi:MAG: hypothetical protein F2693_04075 [Actinobacteria bacterium]|nr:hypothetical protein [Actinomycetota bacterium]
MPDRDGVRLDADDSAHRAVTKQAAMSWPFPIDRRLDQLVKLANDVGANTRRHELAAALVASAPTDGRQLLEMLLTWRTSRVRDVVLGVEDAAQVIELPRHPPGRRRGATD